LLVSLELSRSSDVLLCRNPKPETLNPKPRASQDREAHGEAVDALMRMAEPGDKGAIWVNLRLSEARGQGQRLSALKALRVLAAPGMYFSHILIS
jgi:hypothetical protein